MKSAILATTAAAATLLGQAAANFHVGYHGQIGNAICPSPGFGCPCISSGVGRGRISPQINNLFRETWFSTEGVCGSKKLDFWKRGNSQVFDIYINNASPAQKVGECWPASGDGTDVSCLGDRIHWRSFFWCYTDICGQ